MPILSAGSSFILWLMATSPDRSFHRRHCGCKWIAAWEICPETTFWKKMSILVQQHKSLGTHCRKHPKSAVCCYSTIASALPMLLLLILFLFPFIRLVLLTHADPATLLPLQSLFPVQMVIGGIDLWFLCVVTPRQWPLTRRATCQLLVYIWLTFQTSFSPF